MGRGRGFCLALVFFFALPAAAVAQGWIEPPPTTGGFAVDKVKSQVRVRVNGRVAQVEVTEWFRNDGRGVAEGSYLYPLPGEAVFQGFSLFQGDAELRGEIMDAERARAIYEAIVRRRKDPALIELAGSGLLRARVFPIEPGQERKVTLRYTQVLARAGDALQLVYAGGVRGRSGAGPEGRVDGALHEAVVTSFQVVAEDGSMFLDPFSPTHDVDVRREGRRLTVRVKDALSGRLSLFLPLAGEAVGMSVATHRPVGDDGYVMITLSPGRDASRTEARDVTVVLDVSGSMSGEKIAQARAALRGLLGTLGSGDRFHLVSFSSEVRMLSETWLAVNQANLDDARAWVDRLVADGGTNMGAALDEAFRLESPAGRLPVVIFLTDGLPSVGEQSPERLADRAQDRAGRARVFAFGVGHDVNTHLLDRLSEAGRGTTQYVEPGENVERAMGLMAAKIQHPVLTDLEIAGAPVRLEEIYPVRLPDVFAGEELVLFGRYRGEGEGAVRIRGRRGDRPEEISVSASFPHATDANAFIPRLWASRKLGHLTRQIWTEGETPGLVEEIRRVALRYGLPSPYTSYLVQEPDVVAARDALVAPRQYVLPAAPSAASGAGAVRVAEEARRMREAKSMERLDQAESELAVRVQTVGGGAMRLVAGRIFRLDEGVWKDAATPSTGDVVRVKAFSPAYFRLLEALPELRPVAQELDHVVVAGASLSIEIGERGSATLSPAELADTVRRFRTRS
jgi:Ca-activated chloride channel family protein